MPIERREEAPQLISRSISRRPCRWHPYTPPNTVPAQQSSGQGKLSSVIPWASTHTRSLSLCGRIGSRLFLAPSRHRRFDVVGHSLTSLRASVAIVISLSPPSLPPPALSILTPLPHPPPMALSKAPASHEPFFCLSLPSSVRSPVHCVYLGSEIWLGGLRKGGGGPGISVCVNFWARTRPDRGT